MRRSEYIQSRVLRFRRWSRKAYAVFCSVGRCVNIGHVTKGIILASETKDGLQESQKNPLLLDDLLDEQLAPDLIVTQNDLINSLIGIFSLPILVTSLSMCKPFATKGDLLSYNALRVGFFKKLTRKAFFI